jgi:primosomal protein N''
MENILNKLRENLQVIYRRSVDADEQLKLLRKNGVGKYGKIFSDKSEFNVSSKQFLPYVEEVANNIEQLPQLSDQEQAAALNNIVKKIHLLLTTLDQFKQSLKD